MFQLGLMLLAADVEPIAILLAIIGTGGLSALITATVAFRRMQTQNQVDVRTVAAKEAEVAVTGLRELIGVQAAHLAVQAAQVERQNTEIDRLRGIIEHCEQRCQELADEVRRHDG
jgi:hypothetical protein